MLYSYPVIRYSLRLISANRIEYTMSQDIYIQFKRIKVTESAASTLTEGDAVLTGASVNRVQGQNIAMEIHSVLCHHTTPADVPGINATETSWFALSTRSGESAIPNLEDESTIYLNAMQVRSGAAAGDPLLYDRDVYMPHYWEFAKPLLVSHEKIYPYILTSNAAAAGEAVCVLGFTYVLIDADMAIEALEAFR